METPHFCNCPVEKCPRNPRNHSNGCDPCVKHNLAKGKMPACFYRAVHDDVNGVTDYTIEGFTDFFAEYRDEYRRKFGK